MLNRVIILGEVKKRTILKFDYYNKLEAVITIDKNNKNEFRCIARGNICDRIKNIKVGESILVECRLENNIINIMDIYVT